jgi:WhiB family transcriptional regulator, redox-sensing transcriptional regulator
MITYHSSHTGGISSDTDIREANVTVTMAHREAVATARSTWVKGWAQHGVCSKAEPDALFVDAAAQKAAKQVCTGCPVIAECLADSLDNRTEFGVWGGMTERQRRALLKRQPHVVSWRARFEADRRRLQSSTRPEAVAPDGRHQRREPAIGPCT